MALLEVRDLSINIHGIRPLDGISFHLDKGEILGIVGESGSGKSLTALSVMGLLPLIGGGIERGSVRFDGQDLTHLPEDELRKLRGKRIASHRLTGFGPAQFQHMAAGRLRAEIMIERENAVDLRP